MRSERLKRSGRPSVTLYLGAGRVDGRFQSWSILEELVRGEGALDIRTVLANAAAVQAGLQPDAVTRTLASTPFLVPPAQRALDLVSCTARAADSVADWQALAARNPQLAVAMLKAEPTLVALDRSADLAPLFVSSVPAVRERAVAVASARGWRP